MSIELPNPKDIIFYEVVMDERKKGRRISLITGNTKHFPSNLFVVTPKEMLDIIMQEMT